MLGQPGRRRRSSGTGWSAGCSLRPSSARGWLYAPDTTNSPLFTDPFIHRNLNYDPIKDFVPVTRVGSFTLNPFIRLRSWSTMGGPIPATRRSPVAAPPAALAATRWRNGPKSASCTCPTRPRDRPFMDIIGGRVSMLFADFTAAMPHVKAGTVRPLAISCIHRSLLYPDLPTMDEAGIKGFNLDAWAGLVGRAGRPPTVVTRLNGALREIIDSSDARGQVQERGLRGVFQHARGVRSFHEGPARQVGKHGKKPASRRTDASLRGAVQSGI